MWDLQLGVFNYSLSHLIWSERLFLCTGSLILHYGSCYREEEGVGFQPRVAQSFKGSLNKNTAKFKEIECVINGEESQKCRREGKEVYMPFSFLQHYFEASLCSKGGNPNIFYKANMTCLINLHVIQPIRKLNTISAFLSCLLELDMYKLYMYFWKMKNI